MSAARHPSNSPRRARPEIVISRFSCFLAAAIAAAGWARADEPRGFDGLRVVQVGPVGPPAMRVDLVIVGDGYIADDFGPRGKWEIDSARLVKNFFEKLPFKNLRNLFNVHLVEVRSQDRGADDAPGSDSKRTAFNATYGFNGIDRLLVCQDQQAVIRAARNAPDVDIILTLVNDYRYGGSGGKDGGIPLPTCSTQSTAYLVAIHELGHSFAGLADEYVDESITDSYPLPSSGDLREPNVTLVSLVDTSTPERLIETLKWGHFLEEPGAAKRYGTGYHEGGYYRRQGVYRPARTCAMGSEGGTGGFCYVCEAEMTRAVHSTAARGPAGGVFPLEVPRLKGKLRRPHFFYAQGIFGRVLTDLYKLDRAGALKEDEEKDGAATLRKGVEATFDRERGKVEEAFAAGDVLGAMERLELMAKSFRSTPFERQAAELKRSITSSRGFRRELEAARQFLLLEWAGKSLPASGPERQAWRKTLEALLKKFDGTRAAERARARATPQPTEPSRTSSSASR